MVFATGLFLFGSILCGSAQSMNWLVAARVVQGLGGGGCLTLATVIISDITTLRERPKFLAMGVYPSSAPFAPKNLLTRSPQALLLGRWARTLE